MGNRNYESQILEAIQILVDDAVSKANYDKTIQGTISRCVDATIGKYIVRYQDSSFYAYSHNTETTYPAGSSVYVLVPGNDMSKDKSIIGTVDHLGPDYVSIIEGENGYEVTGVNTVGASGAFELCSYKKEDLKILYDRDNKVDLIGLDVFGFEKYIKKSNSIICGATFKTALDSAQKYRGDYGIVFHLDFTDKSTGETITKSYIVNVDQMTGNPYNYTTASRQYGIFDVDGTNFVSVKQIYLFAYDFPNVEENKRNDIFISNVELSAANALEKEAAATCALTFVTPQGTYFDENNLDTDSKTIQAQIRIKGNAIDNSSQKVNYYWFRENNNITSKSEKYNQYGGIGWECLNNYSIVQEATENSEAVVQWAHSNYQYTTLKKDNVAKETTYKCVAVYLDGTILSKTIVIYNYDSDYEISIKSDSGVAFNYDLGKPTLTCYINGKEETSDIFDYVWSEINSSNQFSILEETATKNEEYNNAITQRDAILNKISAEKLLSAADNENLLLYNQIIAQHEYIMRIEKNKIHNLKISSITNFSTYKCSVYKSGIFIGTSSIIITNTETNNSNYTLIIENGNQIFKYNEKGISPTNGANENPQIIKPLSFTLYDEKGQKINANVIKDIEWKTPSKDTLLQVSLSHGNGVKNEDDTTSYFNDPELNISIAPNYNAAYDKNEIQLILNYNNKVISAKTNLTFIKEGESGTNGTDFVCKIIPNIVEDAIAPKYPAVVYNKYTQQYSLNYTPKKSNIWFKVQLWNDGELIFEGTQSGKSIENKDIKIQWSMLQNYYGNDVQDNSNFNINEMSGIISFDPAEYLNPANIVKAVVRYNNVDYYATLPISVIRLKDSNFDLELLESSGFRHVMYTTDGQSPAYDNQPFELAVFQIVEGVKNNISLFENSEFAVNYNWETRGNVYYSDWKTELNLVENSLYKTKEKRNQKYFKPVDVYNGLCVTNAVACSITRNEEELASIHIPVHFYINRYGNAALNGWDGNSISLDEEGGIILAPQIGAGVKNDDNSFTGVFMGSVKEPGAEKEEHGLFGYNAGQRTITLNSEDGSARFGKAGAGQIVIDPATGEALLTSGNYDEKAGTGMEINLSEPSIKFGSGKFSIDKDGNVVADSFATKENVKELEESISYFTISTDIDNVLIPATSDNIPLETADYTVRFNGKFKGKEVTSFTKELISESVSGITTSFNNNNIIFSVNNTEQIKNAVNTYTIKLTYFDVITLKEYSVEKNITVGLAVQGQDGKIGKSAYQLWLDEGNTGSQAEYLESLKGEKGESAYDVARDNGFEGSESEWLTSLIGKDGEQGIPGEPGENGLTSYLHIAYANSADGTVDFSVVDSEGKKYIGQYTDFVKADSQQPIDYKWTLIKGVDGKDGKDGAAGKSAYQLWLDAGNVGTQQQYIESLKGATGRSAYDVARDNGFEGSEQEWLTSLIGKDGEQGIPGEPGKDGQSSYLHIAYANSADGTKDFSIVDSEGKKYIGQYIDFIGQDSTVASDYKWTLIKGADGANGKSAYQLWLDAGNTGTETEYFESLKGVSGKSAYELAKEEGFEGSESEWLTSLIGKDGEQGLPGQPGKDGQSSYLHIAYANSADGTLDFSTTNGTNKKYMGQYADFISEDSQQPADYIWTLIKGEDATAPKVIDTASGNPITIFDAGNLPLKTFSLAPETSQTTRSGKNLYNINDVRQRNSAISIDKDDWISLTKDNSTGTTMVYVNNYVKTSQLLKTSTSYYIVFEVKEVSGTGSINVVSLQATNEKGQFTKTHAFSFASLKAGDIKKISVQTLDDFTGCLTMLRNFTAFAAGASGSITYRLSVFENESDANNYINYEKFGVSPSPDYPSEVNVVKGITSLLPITSVSKTVNGITFTKNQNGTITLDGTATAKAAYVLHQEDIPFKVGTYRLSYDKQATTGVSIGVQIGESFYGTDASRTIELTESSTFKKWYIDVASGTTLTGVVIYPMLEQGSKQHSFVPYGRWLKIKANGTQLVDFNKDSFVSKATTYTFKNDILSLSSSGSTYQRVAYNIIDIIRDNPGKQLYFDYESYNFSNGKNPIVQIRYVLDGVSKYLTLFAVDGIHRAVTISENLRNSSEVLLEIYSNNTGTAAEASITINKPILQFGTSKLEYSTFKESAGYLDMNIYNNDGEIIDYFDFVKINKVTDEIKNGKILKRIGKIVLNGDEAWIKDHKEGEYTRYLTYIADSLSVQQRKEILSTHFSFIATGAHKFGGAFNYNKQIYFYPDTNKITSMEQWKAWLKEQYDAGTPVIVYYQLENPVEYDLNYMPPTLYENYNHITLNDDLYSKMNIEYYTHFKGDTGVSGTQGETGIGVSSIVEQYYLSNSNTSQEGGSWKETQDPWVKGKYIWTRSEITWTNNEITHTDPILAEAVNSANIEANSANTNANNAINTANSASGTANDAKTAADKAKQDAASATNTANAALEKANLSSQELADLAVIVDQNYRELQGQLDGAIATWFYNYDPNTPNTLPTSEWTTDALKDQHLGDLFYIVDNEELGGQSFRYAKIDGVYRWIVVEDAGVAKAIADASKAQATADGKATIFTGTTFANGATSPVNPQAGDLWMKSANDGILTYVDNTWIEFNKYTDNTVANEAKDTATNAQQEVKKTINKVDVEYYLSTSATELNGGSWSTESPKWEEGKYIWSRQKIYYVDTTKQPTYSNEACITGNSGAPGVASYMHIKYSNDNIKFTGNNGKDIGSFMGVCTTNSSTAPTNFNAYEWSKTSDWAGKDKWRVDAYTRSILGDNSVPSQETFEGETLVKTFLINDSQTTSWGYGNDFLAKIFTYIYCKEDFDFESNYKSDDGSRIELNDNFIKNVTSCAVTPITLNFKKGWNKICILLNEHTGDEYAYFATKLSTHEKVVFMTAYEEDMIKVGEQGLKGEDAITPKSIETAKGNPIVIKDAGDLPLKELKIESKTQQVKTTEGKNIISDKISQWEPGQYEMASGNKVDSTVRIRAKKLIKVQSNTTYYFNTFNSLYTFVIRTYDSNKNFVASIGAIANGKTLTTGSTVAYLGVTIYKPSDESTITFEDYKTAFQNGELTPFICLDGESNKDFEAYIPNSPSPDYPSQVKSVQGITNLLAIEDKEYSYTYTSIYQTKTLKLAKTLILKAGTTYTMSVDIKSSTNKIFNKIYFRPADGSTAHQGTIYRRFSTDYTKVIYNFTLDKDYEITKLDLQNAEADTFYLKHFMLVEGSYTASNLPNYVPFGRWLEVKSSNINYFKDYRWANNSSSTFEKTNEYIKVNMPETPTQHSGIYIDGTKATWKKDIAHLVNKEITFSFYAKADNNRTIAVRAGGAASSSSFSLTTEWKRFSIKIDKATSNVPTFYCGESLDTASYYIKDIMLQEGELTDYAPYKETISLIDMNRKNLLSDNPSDWEQGTTNDNASTTRIRTKKHIEIDSSKTYNISLNRNAEIEYCYVNFTLYDIDKKIIGTYYNDVSTIINGTQDLVVKFPASTKYVKPIIRKTTEATTTPEEITSIQPALYESVTSDSYYEFVKLPNGIADEFSKNGKLIKKIGRFIVDGTQEVAALSDSTNGTKRFSVKIPEIKNGVNSKVCCLSDCYQGVSWSQSQGTVNSISVWESSHQLCITTDDPIITLAEFKAQLAANPISVWCELETYEEYTLDYNPPILHEGYNCISLNDDLIPSMDIEYYTYFKGAIGTGVSSITEEYYLSTSKTTPTGGQWTTIAPTWSSGKYVWTRSKISYSNPEHVRYTTPICDNSWEAVNEIRVGGRNLILGTETPLTIGPSEHNYVNAIVYEGLEQGETYTFSAEITITGTTDKFVTLRAYNFDTTEESARYNLVADGTRVSQTFTVTKDTPSLLIYSGIVGQTANRKATLTQMKLEKGNKATDWMPAPEDVENNIKTAVENIQIGGRNLARGTKNFAVDSNRVNGFVIDPDMTVTDDEEDGFKILNAYGEGRTTAVYDAAYSNRIDYSVVKDKEMTISLDFMVDDISKWDTKCIFIFQYYNAAKTRIAWRDVYYDNPNLNVKVTESGKWYRLEYKTTANKNAVAGWGKDANGNYYTINDVASMDVRLSLFKNGSVHFRKLKIELGNKATDWVPAPEDTTTYVDNLVNDLQTQVDSKIQTYSQSTDPSTSWEIEDKSKHIGDLWYNSTSKETKRWDGTAWANLESGEAQSAAALAQTKAQVFTGTPTPPYNIGDLWITSLTEKQAVIKTCKKAKTKEQTYDANDWVEGVKYTDDTAVNNLQIGGRNLLQSKYVKLYTSSLTGESLDISQYITSGTAVYKRPAAQHRGFYVTALDVLKGNTEYTVHFYAKQLTGSITSVCMHNGIISNNTALYCDGVLLGKVGSTYNVDLTDGLKHFFEFRFTTPETPTANGYNGHIIQFNKTTATEFSVEISELKLEQGNKPTAWTPAPEDVEKSIKDAVDNISIGGRNLALKTSKTFSDDFTKFTGADNDTVPLNNGKSAIKVLTDGLKVGDTVTVRLILEYEDIVAATDKTATCWIQGSGNNTIWNSGYFSLSNNKMILSGSGTYENISKFVVTEAQLENDYWHAHIRTDYIQSGKIRWKMFKVEKGTKPTDWTPAPEDTTTYIDNIVVDLREQIDNKIQTYSQTTDPSTGWKTEEKTQHTGDIWYNSSTKETQRWNGTKWINLENKEAQEAAALASTKAQVFTGTPTPPYYKGDLWITSLESKKGIVKTCKTSRTTGSYIDTDWVEGVKYTDDTTVNNLKIGGRNLIIQSTIAHEDARIPYVNYNEDNNYIHKQVGYVITDKIPVMPGVEYTLSALKPITGYLALAYFKSDDTYLARKLHYINFNVTVSDTVKIPDDVAYCRVSFHKNDKDFIKFEEGNKPTAWTPAPEDVEYSIKTAVDNIIIGGRNLLSKTNQGTVGWAVTTKDGTVTKELVEDSGVNAVKLTTVKTSSAYHVFYYGQIVKAQLKPNTEYTLSFDIYPSVDMKLTEVAYCNPSHLNYCGSFPTAEFKANTWGKYTGTCTFNDIDPKLNQVIYLVGFNKENTSYIFKNLKLEEGNKATAWTKAPEDTDTYIDNLVSELQTQVDNKIQTYNQTTDPSTSWTDGKDKHTGDLWYNDSTKLTQRWNGAKWENIQNAEAQSAAALAQTKAQVFTSTPKPPYNIGDLWITSLAEKKAIIKTCTTAKTEGQSYAASDWVEGVKYTDDTTANNVNKKVILLQGDSTNFSQLNDETASYWGFTADKTIDGHWYTVNTLGRDKYVSNFYECDGGETFVVEYEISTSCQANKNKEGDPNITYVGSAIGLYTFKDDGSTSTGIKYAKRITGSADAPVTPVKSYITIPAGAKRFKVFLQTEAWNTFSGTLKIRNLRVRRYFAEQNYVDNLIDDIKVQVDNKIQTYNQTTDPSTGWTDTASKTAHIGDLWYNSDTKLTQRWSEVDVNGVSTMKWVNLESADAEAASSLAAKKAQVFTGTPTPPYKVGDLWITALDGTSKIGVVKICTKAKTEGQSYAANDWVESLKYTDDTAVNNLQIGGRNYIKYGSGKEQKGFFANFEAIDTQDGYCSHRLVSKKQYKGVSLPGFVLKPREYEVGAKVTFSYDIMYTEWNFPTGSNRQEFWMGQRYTTQAVSGGSTEGQWRGVTQHTLPQVGKDGCKLNEWFHVEKVMTIPEPAAEGIKDTGNISFYNNSDIEASFTFKMRNVKLEYGNRATDWSPAPEDVETEIEDLIVSTELQYYVHNSKDQAPPANAAWSTGLIVSSIVEGKYVWIRTKNIPKVGEPFYSDVTCLVYTEKEVVSQVTEYLASTKGDANNPPGESDTYVYSYYETIDDPDNPGKTKKVVVNRGTKSWDKVKPAKDVINYPYLWSRLHTTYRLTGGTVESEFHEYEDYTLDTSWNQLFSMNKALEEDVAKILGNIGEGYVRITDGNIFIGDDETNPKHLIILNNAGITFFDNEKDGWPTSDILKAASSTWSIDGTLNMQDINVINLTATDIANQNLILGNNNSNKASVPGDLDIYDKYANLMFETIKDKADSTAAYIEGFKIYKYKITSSAVTPNGYIYMSRENGFQEYDSGDHLIFGNDGSGNFVSTTNRTNKQIITNQLPDETKTSSHYGIQMIPMKITTAGDGLTHTGIAFLKY